MPRPRRFELALGLALVQSACADAPGSGVADAVVAPRRDAVPVAGDLGPSPGADAARGADTGLGPANDATGGAQATDGPVTGSSDAQAAGGSADTRVLADTGVPADARGPDARAPDAMRADPCADAVDLNAAVAAAGFVAGDTGGAPAETLGTCGGAAGGEVYFTWTVGPDLARSPSRRTSRRRSRPPCSMSARPAMALQTSGARGVHPPSPAPDFVSCPPRPACTSWSSIRAAWTAAGPSG